MGAPGIRSLIERRANTAGIGHVHAHLFRHSFAHRWLAEGGNETDLMRLVGWRTREMLSRYGAQRPTSGPGRPIRAAARAIGCDGEL